MAIIHWWSPIGRFSQICLLKQIWIIVLLYFWLLTKTKLKNLVILKFKSNSFYIFGYLISLYGKISAVKIMAARYIWLCLLGRGKGFMWFQVLVLEVSGPRVQILGTLWGIVYFIKCCCWFWPTLGGYPIWEVRIIDFSSN